MPGGTGGCGRAPTLWMGHEGCPPRCSPRVFLLLRQRRVSWPDGQEFCSRSCHGWGRSWHLPCPILTPPPPSKDAELRGRRALCAPPTRVITPIRTKCGAGRGAAGIIWGCKECSVGGGGDARSCAPPGSSEGPSAACSVCCSLLLSSLACVFPRSLERGFRSYFGLEFWPPPFVISV